MQFKRQFRDKYASRSPERIYCLNSVQLVFSTGFSWLTYLARSSFALTLFLFSFPFTRTRTVAFSLYLSFSFFLSQPRALSLFLSLTCWLGIHSRFSWSA